MRAPVGIIPISAFIALAVGTMQGQVPAKLCDLLRNPERYNGKEVTVRATYQYGFEWSYLFCLDCRDLGRVWLELSDDLDAPSERVLKRLPKGAGVVNLTVRGSFSGPGSYGHLNGYRYRLIANKAENVVVLVKGMQGPQKEKAAEERSACGGTDPK